MVNSPSLRTPARLLVVEDEKNVGATLVERLIREGFEVTLATTVEAAKLEISRRKFDLALLDIGLPDGSGFDVAVYLKSLSRGTAMIFLSAYGDPEHRVQGLELGAEDYVVKPFHFKELVLRIDNGLKRAKYIQAGSDTVQLGRALIHFSKYEAIIEGKPQELTHREVALLRFLVERKNAVVSRDEILDQVWSENEFPTSRTIDNFIMRLRRFIELDPEKPEIIRSVRGVGYQLVLPDSHGETSGVPPGNPDKETSS
ncbi:MAG: response regulator transcription factor [Methylotenera sp.]|nr:response regulator transcription factor [Oligoflexia bacterium]